MPSGPWEKYQAASPVGPWMKYQQAGDPPKTGSGAGAIPPNDKPDHEGFFDSFVNAVNPIPAIKEYINRPSAIAAAMHGAAVLQRVRAEKRQPTAEEQAAIDAAMSAQLPNADSTASHPITDPIMLAGTQARNGDLKGALGTLTGAGSMVAGPELLGRVLPKEVGPIVKNRNNPTVETALQYLEPDVRMDVGQRTGNRMLQRQGRNLENFPGSSDRAHDFYAGQEQDLAAKGDALTAKSSPVRTNEVGAGQGVQQRLQQRITRLKGQADNFYDQVRSATSANKQTVKVGETPSPVLDASGKPFTTPVMQTFDTPVDLAPMRAQLAPIYEDLQRAMPEARRAASPAFRALQDLMESDQSQMSAMDFDKSLGAIKSLTRNGDSQFLTNRSQGIAKQMIRSGEAQLDQALQSAGPNVKARLNLARKAVAAYHDTADLLADMNSEPAALYNNLVNGGDRSFNTLTELRKVAPNQLKTVGRTFLEGLMSKAGEEGGFNRAAGVFRDWEKLGPETKELMFGKALTSELDNFFLGAKKLAEAGTGSRTTPMSTAARHLLNPWVSAPLEMTAGAIMGHPEAGMLGGAGHIAIADTIPRSTAKLLMTPGGSRLLTQALKTPVGTPAFNAAKRAIQSRILAGDQNPWDGITVKENAPND